MQAMVAARDPDQSGTPLKYQKAEGKTGPWVGADSQARKISNTTANTVSPALGAAVTHTQCQLTQPTQWP